MHTAPSPANTLAHATSTLPLDPARITTPQPVCSAGFRMEPWRSLERLASWTVMAIPLHSAGPMTSYPRFGRSAFRVARRGLFFGRHQDVGATLTHAGDQLKARRIRALDS